MKKYMAGLLLLLLLGFAVSGQVSAENEPVFEDPKLEQTLKTLLQKEEQESLTAADLSQLTSIDIANKKITSLKGLEYAVNITFLDASRNEITDLEPLKGLTKIKGLYLVNNKITSLDPLSGMTDLGELDISGNQVTSLEVIKRLPRLHGLHAEHNRITDIAVLKDAVNLDVLQLNDNLISNIQPVSRLTKLKVLGLDDNQIKDLTPLRGLTGLGGLRLGGNQITDIRALSALTNLVSLGAEGNQIKDITPIANMTKLGQLNLSSNLVYDLEPLRNLKQLTYLYLNHNRIWDITPIEHRKFDFHYDTGAPRYGLQLEDNYLDLKTGTRSDRIFRALNVDPYARMNQGTYQRLVIGSTKAYVGESVYNLLSPPYLYNSRTYVPIRFTSEKLGAAVKWNQKQKQLTIQKDGKTMEWTVGNRQVGVNGNVVMFDAPLMLKNGTSFVPIRFVSAQLNTPVEYLNRNKTVVVFQERK